MTPPITDRSAIVELTWKDGHLSYIEAQQVDGNWQFKVAVPFGGDIVKMRGFTYGHGEDPPDIGQPRPGS